MTLMTRHYTRTDRAESVYQYLVVEVPAGAAALDVTLSYDRTDTILDLGLIGPDRFCGWSGSERSNVVVTNEWATPGYLPGRVDGAWQVVLGLYRVAPGGVDVSIDITAPSRMPATPAPPPLPPIARRPNEDQSVSAVESRRSHVQCHISTRSAGWVSGIRQAQSHAHGWFTAINPPPSVVRACQRSGGSRKSTQPMSPKQLA